MPAPNTTDLNCLPNPGAPRRLNQAEKDQIQNTSAVQEQKRQLDTIEDEQERKRAKKALWSTVDQLEKKSLAQKRAEWFEGEKKDSPEASREASGLSSVQQRVLLKLKTVMDRPVVDGATEFVDAIIEYKNCFMFGASKMMAEEEEATLMMDDDLEEEDEAEADEVNVEAIAAVAIEY